ncbi:MAG TPA: TonB-dependent siderophore receptor [Marinobacter sp.]|uniref:TonB-dependent siderophore receptor n=2 Tax=root TaxID=1 RepID=A0A831VYM6_9GAMM|nr:TonB-dependent siderophore receptor [Marinobacter antarcticus]HDZ39443.1 TonB-dependent siderophore receptor [Marinobacter sp.]HEA51780.1 TonB-dependent siderophore receptor [Marinobacter antarcticus]
MSPSAFSLRPLLKAIRYAAPLAWLGVVPLSMAQTSGSDTELLSPLVVTGTALKVEAPIIETPRPASVVTRDELEERNVRSLDESFRYRAGVVTGQYGSDNDTDWFKVRGYDQSTYQDGLRIYRAGYYQWLPEPYGIERVELLKGPASVLYGEAPPGGVINAISKRPTKDRRGEIVIEGGTNNHQKVGFDSSGPVNDSNDVRYRLVGLYQDAEGDIDKTENKRYYVAPSLEWDISDQTTLTVLGNFQKDDAVPYNGFKLPYGTIENTPFGKVDPAVYYGEPDYDTNEREQSSLGYQLSHQFNDTWRFEQDLRYSKLDMLLRSTYIFFQSGPREGTRGLVYRDGDITSWTIDNRVVGKWFTDRTENTLLMGVDYQNLENSGKEADPFPFGTVDLFKPRYGNYTPVAESDLTQRTVKKQQTGVYLQNQLRLDDQWIFLAGARYDKAETDNVANGTKERADDNQVSLSGGIMYLMNNGMSPYISYTESFQPTVGTDANGALYKPREGKQLEAGIKYAPENIDGYLNTSVYKIEETNSLVTNGAFQVQEGERNTDGFELEGVAYLTNNLQATAAYTYSDSTTQNRAIGADAVRATLIPRHMASAWVDYVFSQAVPGLKVGAGARFVGETKDETYGYEVPSHTVFDVMASYDFAQNWRAQLNINNVANKEYVASCDYWCYYGEARRATASLSYRW